jgi:hypothetical protein
MSDARSPLRSVTRRRLAAVTLLGVLAAVPSHAAAAWRMEPVADSKGVAELRDLTFDAQGRGLLSWEGVRRGHVPPAVGGLASRDPAGGWRRAPDLARLQPASVQIHLFALGRALLVAREAATKANLRRLVVADGQADGHFGPRTALDNFVAAHWSDVNERGDAIIAWAGERSPFLRVAERAAGEPFAPTLDLALGRLAAVSINERGDRVLAWRAGRRLAARVRPAGGDWGPIVRFGRLPSSRDLRLSVLMVRNGRVVLTWGIAGRPCGVSVRDGAGRWRTRTLERRCGPAAVDPGGAPVLPIADSRGATYVAWTGRARSGRRAVKFARVGPGEKHPALVLSRERGAVLDDAAAGPGRALALTYAAPRPTRRNPLLVATFAALRRQTGAFAVRRLTPQGFAGRRGSRIAFHPLTGEPIVALPFFIGFDIAVAAAIGPPAPAPVP